MPLRSMGSLLWYCTAIVEVSCPIVHLCGNDAGDESFGPPLNPIAETPVMKDTINIRPATQTWASAGI